MLIEFKSTHELSMAVTKLQEAIVWIKKDNERIKKELRVISFHSIFYFYLIIILLNQFSGSPLII